MHFAVKFFVLLFGSSAGFYLDEMGKFKMDIFEVESEGIYAAKKYYWVVKPETLKGL